MLKAHDALHSPRTPSTIGLSQVKPNRSCPSTAAESKARTEGTGALKRIQAKGVLWTLVVALATGCSAAGGPGPDYFVVPDRLTDGLGDIVLEGDAGATQNDGGAVGAPDFNAAMEREPHPIDD
jgi:hypothetical protein